MRAGQGVVILSVMLLMLGVVMVNSAGLSVSSDPLSLKEMVLSRPAMLAMLAIGTMWVGSRFPLRLLQVKFAGLTTRFLDCIRSLLFYYLLCTFRVLENVSMEQIDG